MTLVAAAARVAPGFAERPLTVLKGVGPRLAERLARLGLHSVQDLLFHLPLRYQDRTRVQPLGSLRPGDQAVIEATVQLAEIKPGRRRALLVRLADGTGALTLRFFYFNDAQRSRFARGTRLRAYGEVRPGPLTLEMVHPECRFQEGETAPVEEHLTPVYPSTEGLHQLTLRNLTEQALALLAGEPTALSELLPPALLARVRLPPLTAALAYVHRPPPDAPVEALEAGQHPAQRRLAFEELLAHQLSLRRLRAAMQARAAKPLSAGGRLAAEFAAKLPFALTGAQQRVATEIAADLARPFPMQRLVQGDVGSGKTVVAALAALQAVEAGCQAALMAPTELLAEQHYRNLHAWLAPLGIDVAWLSGQHKGRARQAVLERIASGTAPIVVGTHALFQEAVSFAHLALVIVDEQHRFGVHQRLALREKGGAQGAHPHQLIMTATPIPRTLAMACYADLDCSVIDELPPGRTPVETVVIPDTRRDAVVSRVEAVCAGGRQIYWVCTLIEESEALQCQAAEDTAEVLQAALPARRVALVHGRQKPADKERTMAAFKAGEIDLLVATTVIEVGVDVPNATLMVIENAERLGLAQLHQLRGRVGRGAAQSCCVLLYHAPLSEQARARLAILRESNDGFVIARRDLELRGPGEVLGTRQTGAVAMRIADLLRDQDLLETVEQTAKSLLEDHPERIEALVARWVGQGLRCGEV